MLYMQDEIFLIEESDIEYEDTTYKKRPFISVPAHLCCKIIEKAENSSQVIEHYSQIKKEDGILYNIISLDGLVLEDIKMEIILPEKGMTGLDGMMMKALQIQASSVVMKTLNTINTDYIVARNQPQDQNEDVPPDVDKTIEKIITANRISWTKQNGHENIANMMPRKFRKNQRITTSVIIVYDESNPIIAKKKPKAVNIEIYPHGIEEKSLIKIKSMITKYHIEPGTEKNSENWSDSYGWKYGTFQAYENEKTPSGTVWCTGINGFGNSPEYSFELDTGGEIMKELISANDQAKNESGKYDELYSFDYHFRYSTEASTPNDAVWGAWSVSVHFDINSIPEAPTELKMRISQ